MRPQLRFPGFADAWVERKLVEIIVKGASGGTPDTSKEDYYKGTIPFLNISDISNSDGHIFDTEKHITEDALQNSVAWIVPKGAISLAMYASVGKAAILENDVSTSQAFYNMIFENDSTRDVVFQILRKMEMTNGWYYFISRGTQPNLNAGKVKNLSISLPTDIEEQHLIGTFFSFLDRLITLNRHKLSAMKEYKKSMLQRMFPRNGSLPELRFLGFSDAWVEKKVKDLFTITRGNVLPVKMISPQRSKEMFYPVYSSQTKDSGLLGYYNEYLYENAITWTTDGANAGTVAHRDGKFYCTNVCGVLLSNDGYANQCIAEIINLIAWKHVSIAGNPKLMNNVMSEIKIVFPSLVTEQSFIGSFFSNLDRLISLQSKKLSALVLYKKALLQRMFC